MTAVTNQSITVLSSLDTSYEEKFSRIWDRIITKITYLFSSIVQNPRLKEIENSLEKVSKLIATRDYHVVENAINYLELSQTDQVQYKQLQRLRDELNDAKRQQDEAQTIRNEMLDVHPNVFDANQKIVDCKADVEKIEEQLNNYPLHLKKIRCDKSNDIIIDTYEYAIRSIKKFSVENNISINDIISIVLPITSSDKHEKNIIDMHNKIEADG